VPAQLFITDIGGYETHTQHLTCRGWQSRVLLALSYILYLPLLGARPHLINQHTSRGLSSSQGITSHSTIEALPPIHAAYSFQHLLRSLPTLRRLPPPPTLRPLPPLPQAPAFQQHRQRLSHIRSSRLFRSRTVSDLLCLRPHRSHHSPTAPLASRPQQIHPQPASTLAGPAR